MSVNASRVYDSATRYESVVYTSGVYRNAADKSFKGILISSDGNLTITGCDNVQITFPVTAGLYPFAGNSIIQSGTTAGIAVVLY
jgi:hypothetical protein